MCFHASQHSRIFPNPPLAFFLFFGIFSDFAVIFFSVSDVFFSLLAMLLHVGPESFFLGFAQRRIAMRWCRIPDILFVPRRQCRMFARRGRIDTMLRNISRHGLEEQGICKLSTL